jgi:hypothetical protein
MLKKIVLGLSVTACLTTTVFSKELNVKLDPDFCKAYDFVTYKAFINKKNGNMYSGFDRRLLKETADAVFTRDNGALSTDFLKENGIGYSVNMSWGNIALKFEDFLVYVNSKEDRNELSKFLVMLDGISDKEMIQMKNQFLEYENGYMVLSQIIIKAIYNNQDELNKEASVLTSKFVLAIGKQKEIYGSFAKYVINNDFARALEYIKKVNAKTGMNKIYSEFENACEK